MSSVSFSVQNQNARAAMASANDQLSAASAMASKLFTSPNASTAPNNVLAAATALSSSNSVVDTFGQIFLSSQLNAAVLAAQEGSDRVNQKTANLNTSTTKPNGDLSSQVTFSGSLGVDFGPDGPAMGGGYSFKDGAALQDALKIALGSKTSEGETIDTVSRLGNTLTVGTSGPNAHDVATLTLHPDSGLYTFQLVAPIDQKTTKGSFNSIFLGGLMQATTSTGQKMSLPTIEIDVYNDYGSVQSQGNWALLHEGSLTYNAPNGIAPTSTSTTTSSSPKAYTAPTDPHTGYKYTTSNSAIAASINALNIFS
jgi:hypothetical protein